MAETTAPTTVLILDIGTSSAKAVLFEGNGRVLRSADCGIETRHPAPGLAEQLPEDWWRAAGEAVRALELDTPPSAISFAGSMQNVALVGHDGVSVRPAILYSDARIGPTEVTSLLPSLPADFELRIGNRAEPALSLFRLDWLLENEPEAMAATERILFGAKDFVVHRMTGRAVVDPTCATTTGLMSLSARNFDLDILGALGLSPALLPDILDADALAGPLLPSAAAELGLPAGIPVHVGAGDAGATAFGTASETHDRPHAYLGTTGWIAATMPLSLSGAPRDAYTLAAPVGRDVIVVSPFLAAGLAVDWFARIAGRDVRELYSAAATYDAEPPDVLFLPFLIGERAPFSDRDIRGAFLGLGGEHGPEALAYAVLEGLAHAIGDNLGALPVEPRTIMLAGGVAGASTVAQLIADVTGAEVLVAPESRTVTAFGAFRLLGVLPGIGAEAGEASARFVPRIERAERARRRLGAYRQAISAARALAATLRGNA